MKKYICIFLTLAILIGASACSAQPEVPTTTEAINMNILQKTDPAEDDILNLLMIGNSFCYYYPDELFGMAQAAGIKMRICNVYYSGCTLEMHYDWWKNQQRNYRFITHDENGRSEAESVGLEDCLKHQNWDVISLQEASGKQRTGTVAEAMLPTQTQRTALLNLLQTQFPKSRILWHQTWAYQIGYDRNGYSMTTPAQQKQVTELTRGYALAVCKEFGIERVPTGEAWQLVRDGGYDNLCARLAINNGEGDYYHDGDIGGGQYLNACVWFEILTGKSCVGNTFRPDYALDEQLVQTLQAAAHTVVSQLRTQ